jgi:PadR family transcriptional regulator, regulatory protein PadR
MTLQTLKVLKVFTNEPRTEHYGLEICRAAGLPGGTIYPILARLEDAGWLTSGWEDIDPVVAGRRRRRFYQLTPEGAERARRAFDDVERSLWSGRPAAPGPVQA